MENPYQAPALEPTQETQPYAVEDFGGINRLQYLGIIFVLGLVFGIAIAAVGNAEPALAGIQVLYFVLLIVVVYYRLQNIGMSGWWLLGFIVPFLNLYVALSCLICQRGYRAAKKLDTAGRVLAYLILGSFLLVFLIAVLLTPLG